MRVFGLERLFDCFVIVGYSFPEERSRASNKGVFLIFTLFSLREVSTGRFREQIARSKKTPALQAIVRTV